MLNKLRAVVRRDRMHPCRIRLGHLDHCNPYIGSPFGINTFYPIHVPHLIHQGYQSTDAELTQNRINFPISEPLTGLGHGRPILDVPGITKRLLFALFW